MTLRDVGLVYRKELVETLRDRRTLMVMIVLPLALYPVVGISITQWIGAQESRRASRSSRVGIEGARWLELEGALRQSKRIQLERARDGRQRLKQGNLDLLLFVPPDFRRSLETERPVKLILLHQETSESSTLARTRVRERLNAFAAEIRTLRLDSRALPRSLITPLETEEQGISSPREYGAHLIGAVVPLIVLLMVLLGAFYPAIDLTAGEKERGTLETLFVAPVERTSIIAGKYLAVATIATCTGLLNMGSIGITLAVGLGPALAAARLAPEIPWLTVGLTALATIPAALFFSAVMIGVAAIARSFKEAQNVLTPVYMVCMLPAMAAQLPGLELKPLTSVIPIVNISLLIRDLVRGRLEPLPVVLVVVSVAIYTVLALRFAARIFESERLLFAADRGTGWAAIFGRRSRGLPRAEAASGAQAAGLLMVVMALILLVGNRLQAASLVPGLLATEWLLIGLPVLLLVRVGRLEPRTALALAPARPTGLLGALLAGVSAWYLVGVLVEGVQQKVLPMPPEMVRAFHQALFAPERSLALDLFALAVSPAICEELLFRGVLLQTARRVTSTRWAVAVNALLFGLFHVNPYRFLPTLLLGVVLCVLVLRTGSILPAMLFHALNNASAVLVGRWMGDPALVEGQGPAASLPLLGAAVVVFALGLVLAARAGPSAPRGP